MYIATREINTSKQTYLEGHEVQNPSKRMIETGAVRRVPVTPDQVNDKEQPSAPRQSTSKGKKDKAQTVKEPVKEPQGEILTEDSADVEVKTEE